MQSLWGWLENVRSDQTHLDITRMYQPRHMWDIIGISDTQWSLLCLYLENIGSGWMSKIKDQNRLVRWKYSFDNIRNSRIVFSLEDGFRKKWQRERSEGKNAFWSYFLRLRISFIISKCDAPFEMRPEKAEVWGKRFFMVSLS